MAEDAARRAYVAQHVSADLVYVWEEMGVSLLHQRELAERYRSVALFSSIADTRADARAALRNEVTVGDNADGRAAIAALVASWQSCYDMADQERRLKAEAHVLGLPKPLPSNDRMGMRHALEGVVGALEEKDEPSSTYLALKLEEVEAGELRAAVLDEVTSVSDEVSFFERVRLQQHSGWSSDLLRIQQWHVQRRLWSCARLSALPEAASAEDMQATEG